MISRRDAILGGGMLAAAAGAYAFTPRDHLSLLDGRKLETIVPKTIGAWRDVPSSAFVLPKTPGSLADRLYSQTLSRLYSSASELPVMLVIAYGDQQSDALQLHRPEACYAAVGFQITGSSVAKVALAPDVTMPVRELTAVSESRTEPIAYWTRIGNDLPTDGREQRWMKLGQSFRGIIADGVLVRISTVAEPSPETFAVLQRFAAEMMRGVKPDARAALIGQPLATEMNAAKAV